MMSVQYVRINIRAEITAGGHVRTTLPNINKPACFTFKEECDLLLSLVHVIKNLVYTLMFQ